MNKKKTRKTAEKIMELEFQRSLGKNVQSAENEIEIIMHDLSFEEIVSVDNYIMLNWANFKKEKDIKGEN